MRAAETEAARPDAAPRSRWERSLDLLDALAPHGGDLRATFLRALGVAPGEKLEGPGGRSALNGDGAPVQACLTLERSGVRTRLIVDPACHLADPGERHRRALALIPRAMREGGAGEIEASARALVEGCGPRDPTEPARFADGVLWLGVGAGGTPGVAVYVDGTALPQDVSWARAREWLDAERPSDAARGLLLDRLRPHVVLASVGLEGTTRARSAAKLYLRYRTPITLRNPGIALLARPEMTDATRTLMGARSLAASGVFLGIGFGADGEVTDVKLDLSGDQLAYSPEEWARVLGEVCDAHGLAPPPELPALREGRARVSFVGFGLRDGGLPRLNVYLKPGA